MVGTIETFEELCGRHSVSPSGVLHLGAHVGQEVSVYGRWGVPYVAWVEANPELIPALRENVRPYPGHTVHEAAIWDRDGLEMPFFVASNGGSSSLLRMKLHSMRYPEVLQSGMLMVRTTTVDSLLRREGMESSRYDFLNMDLQGAELRALCGMKEQLAHVRWIYTEVNFEELYEGCGLFDELGRFLEERGFRVTECVKGENGWGEALFSRHIPAI